MFAPKDGVKLQEGDVVRRVFDAWWPVLIAAMVAVLAVLAVAGVSSASTGRDAGALTTGSTTTVSSTPTVVSGIKQTGPGLTQPTRGVGARRKGGIVRFAEAPGSPPNQIFPMYAPQYCGSNNIDLLDDLLYRPLYWYGNRYDPTVDYADSIGRRPVVSDGGRTYTIHLRRYMWSDGERVSARDLLFWMNVLEANPAGEWCGYVPGKFPDDVQRYRAINASTFQLTFKRAYNPTWVLYNVLSQLTPMPLAWDKTSMSGKTPSPNSTTAPDLTRSGAAKVYRFLSWQGVLIRSWASSPLWRVVDGPWRVSSTTGYGDVTFVPNKRYSGPVKPSIAKFVELAFTSDDAEVNAAKAEGPNGLGIVSLPSKFQPLTQAFKRAGFDINLASDSGINFFALNFNNPKVGPIFRKLYFRQALQHLIDQQGWIKHYLHGAAVPDYGPMPVAPPSTVINGVNNDHNPYPFSVSEAAKLLSANGWKVAPGGQTRCQSPGTGHGDCGSGIKTGEPLAFTIDYLSGDQPVSDEMQDLQAEAAQVGLKLKLTRQPFDVVYSSDVPCTPRQRRCAWEAENWGAGWIYGPDYLPTGEDLFQTHAAYNYSNYGSTTMDRLINNTITSSAADEPSNMRAYARYAATQLPVVWEPNEVGTFVAGSGTLIDRKLGGYTANALGFVTPENWYLTQGR